MKDILILDFGSQSTHLIQRRLENLGYSVEIVSGTVSLSFVTQGFYKGIIFSGSPSSVYEENSPNYDLEILKLPIPKLGICYGFQVTVHNLGGQVEKASLREYGECSVTIVENDILFFNFNKKFISWMSHGDSIINLPPSFTRLAESSHFVAAAYCPEFNFWGLQFHPELVHTEDGTLILDNFAKKICHLEPVKHSIEKTFTEISNEIKAQITDESVLMLVSGGVDSTVAATLLLKTLNPNQVHLLYIDTGLMRKNETQEIKSIFDQLGVTNFHIVDAQDRYFSNLKDIEDPEKKRQVIGDLFVDVTMETVEKLVLPKDCFLAQGTLYTDLIESGKGVGSHAHLIKTHHNVSTPLIIAKREDGKLIEPLKNLYKDDVRSLGLYLGIPKSLIFRHPFPGPGLAVRIIGEVTPEKSRILQDVDAIYIDELKNRSLYHQIWQALAILLPVKSVGVAGDIRKYGYTVVLRAVSSLDGISAEAFEFSIKDLKEIASIISSRVPEVIRVTYDLSSKPPSTIEWE